MFFVKWMHNLKATDETNKMLLHYLTLKNCPVFDLYMKGCLKNPQ